MKHLFKNILFLFLLVIAFSCNSQLVNKEGVLKGKVIDDENKEGVPNAKIKISCKKITIDTLANLDGEFSISNLPIEGCKIQISAVGYKPASFSIEIAQDSNRAIFPLMVGIKLDSVEVDYTGSSIIYLDSLENVKTAKGKRNKSKKK